MKVTIVLPSLNPDVKLDLVVEGLLAAGFSDIVIVNDGSDEQHTEPFNRVGSHKEVTILNHEVNMGKGRALKTAFSYILANRRNITGVVTVDGDNQHLPYDIRSCAEKMEELSDKVILGCRNFDGANIPFRSRFGNNVTRLVFRLFCGINISDTQTGLRAIPYQYLELLCETKGEKFEYETEMLLTLKKNHIAFSEIPIETVYLEENSSSHFHPVRDSFQIYKTICKFLLSSGASFLIDYGLYILLLFLMGNLAERAARLFFAVFGARLVSSVVNYTLNKKAVFQSDAPVGRSAAKYYLLCVVQSGASYGLVYLLSRLCDAGSLLETVLKPAVDVGLFLISFQVQQKWVFRQCAK